MSSRRVESAGRPLLVSLAFALLVTTLSACERAPGSAAVDEDVALRHAALRGQYEAALIIDLSRELCLLHPMSDRAKSARKARITLDAMEREIVPWPKAPAEQDMPTDSRASQE